MQSIRGGRVSDANIDRVESGVYSESGRILRVALGSAMLGLGIGRGGVFGALLSLAGVEPLLAGMLNFSIIGMLGDIMKQNNATSQSMHNEQSSTYGTVSSRS